MENRKTPIPLYVRLFGHLWAFWGLIVFVSTMIVFLLPFAIIYQFSEPKRTYLFIAFSRVWMGIFLPLVGCPLRIRGRAHFKKGENYIVLCNHNALIDVPVSSPGIPGGNKTIAKIEMARIPVFSMVYKMGSVLVDRKSETSRRESFTKMKAVLAMGLHMCIYPEGTRNKTDQPLKSFHDGAFKLAMATRKPIIPALLFNSAKAMPLNTTFVLLPHALSMHFLPPVYVQDTDTVESLKTKLFNIMSEYYTANKK